MNKFLTFLLLLTVDFGAKAETIQASRALLYKETPQGELNLHIFNPKGHSNKSSLPVVVLFPGDAWAHNSPWSQHPQGRFIADHGVIAVIPHIRSKKHHGTGPRVSVMDTKSSIRWLRTHAAELGIDPNRIAAAGVGEGGHLAAATATLGSFNEPGEDTTVSCIPQALILFNPMLDNSENGYKHTKVRSYWNDFSPLHNMKTEMPPALIIQGTKQLLMPLASVEAFKEKMDSTGNRCELMIMEGETSDFHGKDYPIEESIPFLISLGWIE